MSSKFSKLLARSYIWYSTIFEIFDISVFVSEHMVDLHVCSIGTGKFVYFRFVGHKVIWCLDLINHALQKTLSFFVFNLLVSRRDFLKSLTTISHYIYSPYIFSCLPISHCFIFFEAILLDAYLCDHYILLIYCLFY